MIKKSFLIGLLILPTIALLMSAPTSPAQDKPQPSAPANFDTLAEKALQAMKQRAAELNVKGVAVVSFAPGESIQGWSSKMLVVGNLRTPTTDKDKGNNLLGIAYSKAAEMAETLKDSGSGVRPPLTGETGWQGGVTAKGKTGQIIVAFSGGASADDVKISRAGMAVLTPEL